MLACVVLAGDRAETLDIVLAAALAGDLAGALAGGLAVALAGGLAVGLAGDLAAIAVVT